MHTYILKGILIVVLVIAIVLLSQFVLPEDEQDAERHVPRDAALVDDVGEMLLVGFRGTQVDAASPIVAMLTEQRIGGVILFDFDVPSGTRGRNITDPEQTRALIEGLVSHAPKDIFVAVDAEGGYVNRLKADYGFIDVPSAQVMGEMDEADTYDTYRALAGQLAELGFNLNFAPVVDVNTNPDNPVIGYLERSFSEDPEAVARHAAAAVAAHADAGVLTALKHFPGHGSSDADSHLGMVDITDSYDRAVELTPYRSLIDQGFSDLIMTAHVMERSTDAQYPATLSPMIITGWLRDDLGFDGVIVSDDMQMGGIEDHFGFEEALVRAVQAGVDMLILSNHSQEYDDDIARRAVDALVGAVERGELSRERIAESAERIRTLKMRLR